MKLLLTILALAAPVPPAVIQTSPVAPPSETLRVEWTLPGADNYFVAVGGEDWATLQPAGAATEAIITGLTNAVWVGVAGVQDGLVTLQTPLLFARIPADVLREFFAVLPDGQKITLGTTTNTPPGDSGFYRVQWREWKDY